MAKKNSEQKGLYRFLPFANGTTNFVIANMPYIFFLGFLGLIYIANVHYGEKKVRDIQKLQVEIQKMSWEYMSIKSDLMKKCMQSEVAEELEDRNVQELREKPIKILADKEEY